MSNETETLQKEIDQFREEKEKIRVLVGQIGGKQSAKRDQVLNIIFITALTTLFVFDILRHVAHVNVPLPSMLSLELGLLMVSLKIIWMIHKQSKVEHFQFWILNSIEFRLNDLNNKVQSIADKIDTDDNEQS